MCAVLYYSVCAVLHCTVLRTILHIRTYCIACVVLHGTALCTALHLVRRATPHCVCSAAVPHCTVLSPTPMPCAHQHKVEGTVVLVPAQPTSAPSPLKG